MSKALTEKQAAILSFIEQFSQKHGFPPTIREIGGHFQMASSSALDHVRALERKGSIRRSPLKPRCIEILRDAA